MWYNARLHEQTSRLSPWQQPFCPCAASGIVRIWLDGLNLYSNSLSYRETTGRGVINKTDINTVVHKKSASTARLFKIRAATDSCCLAAVNALAYVNPYSRLCLGYLSWPRILAWCASFCSWVNRLRDVSRVRLNRPTSLCDYCQRQGIPCSRLTRLEQAAATHNLSTVTADIQEEAEVLSVWPQFLVVIRLICFPELWLCDSGLAAFGLNALLVD